jgi:hypothetical protein
MTIQLCNDGIYRYGDCATEFRARHGYLPAWHDGAECGRCNACEAKDARLAAGARKARMVSAWRGGGRGRR